MLSVKARITGNPEVIPGQKSSSGKFNRLILGRITGRSSGRVLLQALTIRKRLFCAEILSIQITQTDVNKNHDHDHDWDGR
jgi:hypothetical protein